MNSSHMQMEFSEQQEPRVVIFLLLSAIFFGVAYVPGLDYLSVDLQDSVEVYGHGSNIRKISLISLAFLGFFVCLKKETNQQSLKINGFLGWLSLVYVALGFFSITWAADPMQTAKRIASILCLYIGVYAFLRRFNIKNIVDFILIATGLYLSSGLIYEIVFGLFTPLKEGYRFAGMFHPNTMGLFCALLLISALSKCNRGMVWSKYFSIVSVIGFLLLVLTKSRTMFFAVLCAIISRWILDLPVSRKLLIATIIGWFICLFLLFVGDEAYTLLLKTTQFGRNVNDFFTLNGRTLLWNECITDYVTQRPFLGYGLGGFWNALHIYDISSSQTWALNNGHSVYLDQLLELGITGLSIYLLILITAVMRCIRQYKVSKDPDYGFFFTLFVFILAAGLLETFFPAPDLSSFVIFSAVGYLAFGKSQYDA